MMQNEIFWDRVVYATHTTHKINLPTIMEYGILPDAQRMKFGIPAMGIDDFEPMYSSCSTNDIYTSLVFDSYIGKSMDNMEFQDENNVVLIIDIKQFLHDEQYVEITEEEEYVYHPLNRKRLFYYNMYDNCGRRNYDAEIMNTCTINTGCITAEITPKIIDMSDTNELVLFGDGIPIRYIGDIWYLKDNDTYLRTTNCSKTVQKHFFSRAWTDPWVSADDVCEMRPTSIN